ncbi:sigma-70 family RNA polymerase sigma factor [Cohnella nanjingensis]|uniref:Sigma-70 family RNA polymerase sigma factor n=2 Tax=Cohnella nanjingensis TaxID=1387779 RepID=A0A7X0RLA9_9BACL|nr:sigma-70 family RNA polymerase sigma factor [Cohnella nanjingensis]
MHKYGQDVWNLAFILTRSRDMADDVSQDVFLKAYTTIGSFRGSSSVRTWLLAITRNTSINAMRTAFMRRVTLTAWVTDTRASPSAEIEALARTLSDEIWAKVLALPFKLREVLILQAKYEMSIREIADLLRLSEGTVKSRLARARGRMTDSREEEEADA